MAAPETEYNTNNYTPDELKVLGSKYKEVAPQLQKIKDADKREDKVAIANSLADSQRDAIMKMDPLKKKPINAAVIFTLVAENLFRANQFMALSDDQKANRAAGKAFFSAYKEMFKDYFFERASMKGFEPGILKTCSGLLMNLSDEDPAFRKSVIARMETIFRTKKGNIDDSVTQSTVIAPLIKAKELLPLLRSLQDTPGMNLNEKKLYRITADAINKEILAAPQQQNPMPLKR
jgi:hypothetical protein